MIESIKFQNFKALRATSIPLSQFTLIIGPNGSGKSSVLQALRAVGNPSLLNFRTTVTALRTKYTPSAIEVAVKWGPPDTGIVTTSKWTSSSYDGPIHQRLGSVSAIIRDASRLDSTLRRVRTYSFDAQAIAAPAHVTPNAQMDDNGANLASVLDNLNGADPERFEALNHEMSRWLPEFNRILFETPDVGRKSLLLRRRGSGRNQIQATEVSQGTLLALAMLTLAYLPAPPGIVCLEEPERGIHPRLLREVRDAMYRLSYPENFEENRNPVQVIATTHSPYLLDLFKDHPEEVVIANRVDQDVQFERLSDRSDIDEILGDTQLGDAWYSGVLGGVPSHP